MSDDVVVLTRDEYDTLMAIALDFIEDGTSEDYPSLEAKVLDIKAKHGEGGTT